MKKLHHTLLIGDAMIPSSVFESHFPAYLEDIVHRYHSGEYEPVWSELQRRRLEVEKKGPEIELVPPTVEESGAEAEMIMGLFVPISTKLMDAMPKLRIAGVCRAGLENVNVKEATKRGILVFNVLGRNAEAVSDFTLGLMLAESRNIARAHFSVKNGRWRKTFSNSDFVPQLKGKTVGIIGFGHIGRLVAKKLSGFDVKIIAYDPFADDKVFSPLSVERREKDELFRESDFVTVHARLSEESKGSIGKKELESMKETAYLINTGRAGLIDHAALLDVLKKGKIAGAGLDVFPDEPLPAESEFIELDNVTLTTHIAGTTYEALNNSPALLMEDIRDFLLKDSAKFIVNREVLENPDFMQWLEELRK
jgi:D-3-phosphoglycerate dehydrogenase / 2-oxoglutarate reductase